MIQKHQIPNLLTFARVAAVPLALVLIVCFPLQQTLLFLLFVAAAVTDYYDGYLARKWNSASPIGALLDPIADKLLVTLMLLYCMLFFGLSLVPVAVIISRELYISGLREFLAAKQIALPVSKGGKWKTAAQMVGISGMLCAPVVNFLLFALLGEGLIWIAAILAVTSAWEYSRASLHSLTT